jgi:hypothetical protein
MKQYFGKTVTAKVKVYNECKYQKKKLESKTIIYKNVIAFGVISGDEAKEIEKTTDRDNIDDCHEYMVLYFSDGTISTFRNSYVDLFII